MSMGPTLIYGLDFPKVAFSQKCIRFLIKTGSRQRKKDFSKLENIPQRSHTGPEETNCSGIGLRQGGKNRIVLQSHPPGAQPPPPPPPPPPPADP